MNSRIIIGVITAVVLTAPATARRLPAPPKAARVRTVQFIPMILAVPTTDASDARRGGAQEAAAGPAMPRAASFTFNDLSRRWLEHQMHASLASSSVADRAGRIRDDGPLAFQKRPDIVEGENLGSVSPASLTVPRWMLGPGVSAAPTDRLPTGCAAGPYRPSGLLAVGNEVRRQAFYGMMSSVACEYGIPVGLFDAMIIRESRYDPAIVSPKNAFGLTQLMPATAVELGVNRYDVEQNLRGGARYLRRQLDRFGQAHLALAAYNAGPARVHEQIPSIAETQGYVADILSKWAWLDGFGPVRAQGRMVMSRPGSKAVRAATSMTF